MTRALAWYFLITLNRVELNQKGHDTNNYVKEFTRVIFSKNIIRFLILPSNRKRFSLIQNVITLLLQNCYSDSQIIVRDCYIWLSRQHTWPFYTPIAANLIARENHKRFSPPIDADTLGDFFRRSRRYGSFEKSCDEIAQPDGLALLAILSNDRTKSWRSAYKIAKCVAGFTEAD